MLNWPGSATRFAMLKSRKPKPIGLFVPKDTHQQGHLNIEGRVLIEGRFSGSIDTDDALEITKTGAFTGNCTAQRVENHGDCQGKFIVNGRFSLKRGARFSGLLDTNQFSIEDGSFFEGELRVSSGL